MFEININNNYQVLNNCFLDNLEKGTIESELTDYDYLNEDYRQRNYLSQLILFFNNIFHLKFMKKKSNSIDNLSLNYY